MREKKKSSSWFPAYFCAVHIYYGKGAVSMEVRDRIRGKEWTVWTVWTDGNSC